MFFLTALVSCTADKYFSFETKEPTSVADSWAEVPRVESEETRSVMLLYSAGFMDIANYLDTNIKELDEGFIPRSTTRGDHILLVYSRLTARTSYGTCSSDFSVPTKSALFRIYKDKENIIKDTLKVWGEDVNASSPETMEDVLRTVYNRFPAKTYGMVFSSHASGWLPKGYYSDASIYEGDINVWRYSTLRAGDSEYPPMTPYPAVKSLGQDYYSRTNFVEMELDDFARAIPFKLDYLLLDACLSGTVEVAYELRGKADIVGFSQTEVLAQGFNYKTITTHLLKNTPDPLQVCKDYFEYYDTYLERNPDAQSWMRSATISVIDTRQMDPLAEVCNTLFEKYREKLKTMSANNVQGYFRGDHPFFYDLEDILVKAGITADEKALLDQALDQCVVYKAATDIFISFKINTACGFSMYLPSKGTDFLDSFYMSHLAWNKATGLVK